MLAVNKTKPFKIANVETLTFSASTFPTIQADMGDKSKFTSAALISMLLLFLMYFPTAAVGYFSLGNCVKENVILSMSDGGLKMAAECVILLHLVSALPIIINPPSQFFEEILHIPKGQNNFLLLHKLPFS